MRRNDTVDKGPNKLLLKEWDAQAYVKHRQRVSSIKPMVDFGTGKHIVRVSPHGPNKKRSDRANEIMNANRILYERIKGVLDRPAYQKQTMFDSKTIAAKASLSPIALQRTFRSNNGSSTVMDSPPGTLLHEELQAAQFSPAMQHDSHLLLPTTKNFILPKRLEVSPRQMKIFHGHSIGNDNSVNEDLKSTKRQVQVGQNMVRILHNHRQDKSEVIMKENHQMLQRLLQTGPGSFKTTEMAQRPKVLSKRGSIASQQPLRTTCFNRSRRLMSVTTLKKQNLNDHSESILQQNQFASESLSNEDLQLDTRREATSEIKFKDVPNTTRNRQNVNFGLTQPHFPKVTDQLGQTADGQVYEAITHRENEENETSYAEGVSLVNQKQYHQNTMISPQNARRNFADLSLLKKRKGKKQKRQLDPIMLNVPSGPVGSGIRSRKQSMPQPLTVQTSPGMSANKFSIKKRSVNALSSSRHDTNAMNSTHMTVSDVSASNRHFQGGRNDSIFRATNSSYLQGVSHVEGPSDSFQQKKADFKVVSMSGEGDVYHHRGDSNINTESQQMLNRLTIYQAKIIPNAAVMPSVLELQRDMLVTNKLFIILYDEDGMGQKRELHITLKQATNLLVKVKHDFKNFVEELLCSKHGQIAVRNLSFKVFDPTQGNYSPHQLLNQSSSKQLQSNVADGPYKSMKTRELGMIHAPQMIVEEEDPPSRSYTDTSGLPPESKTDTSERDFMKDLERMDEDIKRKTYQVQSPGKHGVSFKEDLASDELSDARMAASIDTRQRPRANEIMADLDLKMDLSDADESKTNTDQQTEQLSKTEYRAIIEESSSQNTNEKAPNSSDRQQPIPAPEGHESVVYNDFLGRQQTRVHGEQEVVRTEILHKVPAITTGENTISEKDEPAKSSSEEEKNK